MTQLIGLADGAAIDMNAYFLATFSKSTWGFLEHIDQLAQHVYDSLRSGSIDYIAPINTPQPVPGDSIVQFAIRTFPGAELHTNAEFAAALESASVYAHCDTLKSITYDDAYDPDFLASEKATRQATKTAESPLTKLENYLGTAGWVLLAITVVILLVFGHKAWRELST